MEHLSEPPALPERVSTRGMKVIDRCGIDSVMADLRRRGVRVR